jgi:transposase
MKVTTVSIDPDIYDSQPNRLYDEFVTHYGCTLLAARPAHPRDKPKVENAVLVVERWILARLRNRRLFDLVGSMGSSCTLLEVCT